MKITTMKEDFLSSLEVKVNKFLDKLGKENIYSVQIIRDENFKIWRAIIVHNK